MADQDAKQIYGEQQGQGEQTVVTMTTQRTQQADEAVEQSVLPGEKFGGVAQVGQHTDHPAGHAAASEQADPVAEKEPKAPGTVDEAAMEPVPGRAITQEQPATIWKATGVGRKEGVLGGVAVRVHDRGLATAGIIGEVSETSSTGFSGFVKEAVSLAAFYRANQPKIDEAIRKAVEKHGHIVVEGIDEWSLLVRVKFLSVAGYWVLRSLNEKVHRGTDRTCLQLLLEDELQRIGWTGPVQVGLEGWWFAGENGLKSSAGPEQEEGRWKWTQMPKNRTFLQQPGLMRVHAEQEMNHFAGRTSWIRHQSLASAAIFGGVILGATYVTSQAIQSPTGVVSTGLAAGAVSLAALYLFNRLKTDNTVLREAEKQGRVARSRETRPLREQDGLTVIENSETLPPSLTTEEDEGEDTANPEDTTSETGMSSNLSEAAEEGPLKWQRAGLQKHKDSPTAQRYITAYRSWEEGAEILNKSEYIDTGGLNKLAQGFMQYDFLSQSATSTILYDQQWLNLDKTQLDQLITSQLQAIPTDSTCRLVTALQLPDGDTRVQALQQVVAAILQHGPGDWLYDHLHHIYCYLGWAIWHTSSQPRSPKISKSSKGAVQATDLPALAKALSTMASSLMYKRDNLNTVYYTAVLSGKVYETEAIRQFEHFLGLAPECDRLVPYAHYFLARLYKQQQNRQKVIQHFTSGQQTENNRLSEFPEVPKSIKDPARKAYEHIMAQVSANK